MDSLSILVDFLRGTYRAATLPAQRGATDVFADRLRRAGTEPTLALACEHLLGAVQVSGDAMSPVLAARLLGVAGGPDGPALLAWWRSQTRLLAMLASVRDDALVAETLAAITLPAVTETEGVAVPAAPYALPITVTCTSALAHGAEGKAGNATLFRRQSVLATNGAVLSLPYYSGNAVRGQMRDLLAAHVLRTLDVRPSLWFFYALYSGGALEEQSAALKGVAKQLGDHGAIRTQGLRELRERVPMLSLLGCALGNRVLPGRVRVGDLRPRCREWASGDGPAAALLTWEFLTRREDDEAHAENHSMIATTEVLKAGTVLDGGIDVDAVTERERACLGLGLRLLVERGQLGAENRRGLGRVTIAVDAPDPAAYLAYLHEEAPDLRDYLASIGAIETAAPAETAA